MSQLIEWVMRWWRKRRAERLAADQALIREALRDAELSAYPLKRRTGLPSWRFHPTLAMMVRDGQLEYSVADDGPLRRIYRLPARPQEG